MLSKENPVLVIVEDEKTNLQMLKKNAARAQLSPIACSNTDEAILAIDKYNDEGVLIGALCDLKLNNTWGGWSVLNHAFNVSKRLHLAVYSGYFEEDVNVIFGSGAVMPSFKTFKKPRDSDNVISWMNDIKSYWDNSFGLSLKDADTKEVYEKIAPVYSNSSLPILILGETGTGKESLAKHIHNMSGNRGPFIAINCGGLEPSLATAELFGNTATAYTDAAVHKLGSVLLASGYKPGREGRNIENFETWLGDGNSDLNTDEDGLLCSESAKKNSGTLFLDEIATLSPKTMAGLLRVLSTHDVFPIGQRGKAIRSYCRIITATNEIESIKNALTNDSGTPSVFRRDLYYRLGGAVLTLAPLRDRDVDDIRNYVKNIVWHQLNISPMEIDDKALKKLEKLYKRDSDDIAKQYQKGNFRTLRNLIHRAALIARADNGPIKSISLTHINLAISHGEIKVKALRGVGKNQHIRSLFRDKSQEHGINLTDGYGIEEIKGLIEKYPTEIGDSFLECVLTKPLNSALNKEYYYQREIEEALTHGRSGNSLLNKYLNKYITKKAAIEHRGLEEENIKNNATIQEIVRIIRGKMREKRGSF